MKIFEKEKIEALYPEAGELMIDPMLIKLGEQEQLKEAAASGDYFSQEKIDGYLGMFIRTPNHSYFFTRTVSKKTGLLTEKIANIPHIQQALDCIPANTIILGEIYYPGGTSKNCTEIMGCLPAKAIKRQEQEGYGLIHYYIYDVLKLDGRDLITEQVNNLDRYNLVKDLFEKHNLGQYDFLRLAENIEENIWEKTCEILEAGGEGMVYKLKTGLYEPGKRPSTNLKAKQVDHFDCFIIGFEKPEHDYRGKEIESWQYWENEDGTLFCGDGYRLGLKPITKYWYNNWMNSDIKVGVYDENNNVIDLGTIHSGISDDLRADMSKNPDKYLNRVIEVQCMSIDKEARTLRHAFLVNFRDDKNKEECLWTCLANN